MRCVKLSAAKNALLAAAAILALCGAANAQEPTIQRTEFKIEAATLSEALQAFGRQSGKAVMYSEETVARLFAPRISGSYTDRQALALILEGSGLEFAVTTNDNFIVRTSASEVKKPIAPSLDGNAPELNGTKKVDEIVATGTNIRGIAPESSPAITFDQEAIRASGFQSIELFIRSLPQAAGGSDNRASGLPRVSGGADENNIAGSAINLRGLGAGATLTLLNGRRLSPSGSVGSFIDISAIPLAAIERVEILTDGASAIYGADAVAGVANFVLRDDYDGAESQASYGAVTEGNLNQYRASQVVGRKWKTGNILGSYEFFQVDELAGDDKAFARDAPSPFTLLPSQERHSGILSLNQSVMEGVELSVDGYYSTANSEQIINTGRVNSSISRRLIENKQVAIAPKLNFQISTGWAGKVEGNYAETEGRFEAVPLDNLATFSSNTNHSALWSIGAQADGPIFTLPGGAVRVAAGAEYRFEEFKFINTTGAERRNDREIYALYTELFVPLLAEDNNFPSVKRFELSVAGRWDSYSDFGGTFNPKVGVLWELYEDLRMRGSYSTSFNPPALGNLSNRRELFFIRTLPTAQPAEPLAVTAILFGIRADLEPQTSKTFTLGFDYSKAFGDVSVEILGSYYSIDFEKLFAAVPLPGNSITNIVSRQNELPSGIVVQDPSQDMINSAVSIALAANGITNVSGVPLVENGRVDASGLDYFFDLREGNLARASASGWDFSTTLRWHSQIGEWEAGASGNYVTDLKRQAAATSPEIDLVDTIFFPANLRVRGRLNWERGSWRASAFLNYTDSYVDNRTSTPVNIDSYKTVDINIAHKFPEKSRNIFSNAEIIIGAINLLNQDPPSVFNDRFDGPAFTNASYDAANADPRGRFVFIELRKKW